MSDINMQNDPLGAMTFMAEARRLPVIRSIGESWQATLHELKREIGEISDQDFMVLLGNEAELREGSAEFIIYSKDLRVVDAFTPSPESDHPS